MELPYACRDGRTTRPWRTRLWAAVMTGENCDMDIGIYGLGRMGGNMATRLAQGGHRVVAANRSRGPVDEAVTHGAEPAYSIQELVSKLKAPRVLWAMVPAGARPHRAAQGVAQDGAKSDIFGRRRD